MSTILQFYTMLTLFFLSHVLLFEINQVHSAAKSQAKDSVTTMKPVKLADKMRAVNSKPVLPATADKKLNRKRRSLIVDTLGDVYHVDDDNNAEDENDEEKKEKAANAAAIMAKNEWPVIFPDFEEIPVESVQQPVKRLYSMDYDDEDDDNLLDDSYNYWNPGYLVRKRSSANLNKLIELNDYLQEIKNRLEQQKEEEQELEAIDNYLNQAFRISKIAAEMDEAERRQKQQEQEREKVKRIVQKRLSLQKGKNRIYYDLVDLNGIPGMFIPINQKASNFADAPDN